VNPTESAVLTPQATATREFVQVIAPLLPTGTEAATAVAILPPPTAAATQPPAEALAIVPNQWLSYALFGVIVFGLGAMLLLAKR
jgi:hypothetical protein